MVQGDTVDGIDVRVVELTGAPGDLVVMHPWLLHNISMNVADTPRMMSSFSTVDATYQPSTRSTTTPPSSETEALTRD
jgi:hypothetical protein